MEHVVKHPAASFTACAGGLEVHQVPLWKDNLGWLLVCAQTGECAAVDGTDAGPVLDFVASHGWNWTTIFNTHTHADHVGINRDLAKRGLLEAMRVFGPGSRPQDVPGITDLVNHGDEVVVGNVHGQVWLTEGHIDGHVSFIFGDENDPDGPALFCGDTLFAAGCGYLFDGPPTKMHDSLQRLGSLDPRTRVCCAHEYTLDNLRFAWSVEPGNVALSERISSVRKLLAAGGCAVPSTIAEERATNPFMRTDSAEIRDRVAEAMGVARDAPGETIFAATRGLKDTKMYREIQDTELPA